MNSLFFHKINNKVVYLIESRFLLIEFYEPAIVCKITPMFVTTAVKFVYQLHYWLSIRVLKMQIEVIYVLLIVDSRIWLFVSC